MHWLINKNLSNLIKPVNIMDEYPKTSRHFLNQGNRRSGAWMPAILLFYAFHIFLSPFSQADVSKNITESEMEIQYLSGTDNEHTVTWEFFCTGGRGSGFWTTIEVPSCWEQQGFGTYNYGRDYVTYGRNHQFADEKGMYRYTFLVPESWKSKVVNLVFEGSMTDTEVKINGHSAGEIHKGSFYRFSYPVTGFLNFGGENLLEVTVSKMSADQSVNRAERYADYWIFGGIFRPVYLEAYPRLHISHVTLWGEADGSFYAHVSLDNAEDGSVVRTEIVDPEGNLAGICSGNVLAGDSLVKLSMKVVKPATWTSETPFLYKAVLSLVKNGKTLYRTEQTFGFRTVEIRHGDGIYLNGVKIKMKGINRHAFWPETGRTLNRNIDRMDVELIKGMNMNAMRCSHYPPDKSFLEICDSLGLYVLDELAGWQNAYNTVTGSGLVREMVLRDVNHPCIIFWSNGNEGGTNRELDDDFLQYDPTGRQVIHCHHRPGNDYNGIETNHYESYESTGRILEDSLIYMTTEFLHAQNDGGGGAGLEDYWEMMYASERSGGGFLWALIDEGLVRTDWNGFIDVNLVNAPDGVLGPHREKEGSYLAIREIYSPVIIRLHDLPGDFSGDLPLENRYHFINLSQCTFKWQLLEFPSPMDNLSGHTVLNEGALRGPDLAPGMKGKIHIPLPEDWKESHTLMLTAIDPHGEEILTRTWKTGDALRWLDKQLQPETVFPEVTCNETDNVVSLSANDIVISFDKHTGLLTGVKNNRERITSFHNGPVLCAGESTFEEIIHFREGDNYVVEVHFNGTLNQVRWTMYPDGWVKMEYSYHLSGRYPFAGITFNFEEGNVISVRWLGQGPYRIWKNRMQGGTLNVWEKAYNNTLAGTYPWNFPEFKGYHARVSWMELNTLDGKILMVCPDDRLFIRLFDFHAFPSPTPEPELPPGDISFLDAIPPVGTKMSTKINANAASTGPGGYLNELEGIFTHTIYFDFGILPRLPAIRR
jgi:hypothetical protein